MDLFEFADVSLRIGDITILSHVSMRMEPGEIVTIVGPNGSGKSTLLRLLIGSLTPSEGRILRDRGLRI
ncbi:ATP-binding cassette domain-containing protein, partial [Rhodovulum sulfidophilum]|nr:ATP-binding cassette domain-containing protein [Rhodovulum sulfidophilum]